MKSISIHNHGLWYKKIIKIRGRNTKKPKPPSAIFNKSIDINTAHQRIILYTWIIGSYTYREY